MQKTWNQLTTLIALLLAGCSVASAQLPPPPAEPVQTLVRKGEIQLNETSHDFGNIWDHEKVDYNFVFKNVGEDPLTIVDVQSSCGCTVPELTKKLYAPGEEGKITVIFNPQNRSGQQRKSITVTTDSARTPRVALNISADVTKVLDVQPSIANLGRVYKNEEKGMKLFVIGSTPEFKAWPAETQPEDSPFRIEVVEDAPTPPEATENGWNVFRVWIEPGLAVGRHTAEIKIMTNDERRPMVQVRGVATIVGDLQARPPRFALGRLEPGEAFESELNLINRVAEEFKIEKIEVTGEAQGLEVSFEPTVEGKYDAYNVKVSGTSPTEAERILGRVVIHTSMESEPTFEIPVYGFVNQTTTRRPQTVGTRSGG